MYHQNRTRAEGIIKRGERTMCETMGLSVYADENDAVQCALQYPNIGNKIARLTLTPASGRAIPTDGGFPSHHTWWKVRDFNPIDSVEVVHIL